MCKKVIIISVILALAMFFCGCENMSISSFDNTIIPDRSGNSEAFNDVGIFFNKKGVVYMLDPSTGISAPLCSKVNCDHRGKTRDNTDPTCDAYFAEALGYSAIVGSKLYCLVKTPDGSRSYFTKEFYSADKNGTNRKLLFRADDIQFGTHGSYENGYFLYGYYNTETPNGEELDKEEIGMCIVNLETEELTRIHINDKYSGTIWGMTICDGKLYYGLSYRTVDLKEYDYDYFSDHEHIDTFNELYMYEVRKYDFETGETETVFTTKTIPKLFIGYGYLYYSQDGKEHVVRELTTGREFCIGFENEKNPNAIFSDGILFIDDNKIGLWRYGTEFIKETGYLTNISDNRRLYIECITNKWVYASLYNDEDETIKVYCPKDDFMKGKYEWCTYDIE